MLFPAHRLRFAPATLFCLLIWAALTTMADASIGLVVGEPFGAFGTMMPNGHASIYLDHLCPDTPTHLRPCLPGEHGAVISRYHDLRHPALDWIAFPARTFFYGVDDPADVPRFITRPLEIDLRTRYWAEHLQEQLPGQRTRDGGLRPPAYGDWDEGIGAAFDRRLLVYVLDTTAGQDETLMRLLNEGGNRRRYTLGRANCADFAADLLRIVVPTDVVRRSVWADFDMTTPKNLAREMDAYGSAHPELHPQVIEVPQLPGTLRRSRPLRGAADTLLKTKRYLATLLVLQPEVIVASWGIYEKRGKWTPGLDAVAVTPADWPAPAGALDLSAGANTNAGGDATGQTANAPQP